jgi:hypothetical protein
MPDRLAYAGLLTVLHAAFFARVAAAAYGACFSDGAQNPQKRTFKILLNSRPSLNGITKKLIL